VEVHWSAVLGGGDLCVHWRDDGLGCRGDFAERRKIGAPSRVKGRLWLFWRGLSFVTFGMQDDDAHIFINVHDTNVTTPPPTL